MWRTDVGETTLSVRAALSANSLPEVIRALHA